MKILGFQGSPRENGNREERVKAILEGSSEDATKTKPYEVDKMNTSSPDVS